MATTETVSAESSTFQKFLDQGQYTRNNILKYEKIFGENFVSTGGLETTEHFVKMLELKSGQTVLDVGCGIGGSAFYMAQNHGVTVLGIDLSSNMVEIAKERIKKFPGVKVEFEVADATTCDYQAQSFDVIYSRDTILHIADKESLFKSFLKWLKPGGRLLITDYCCTPDQWSEDFTKYVSQRGYHLLSPKQYGQLLETVGFVKVTAEDNTDLFVDVLRMELAKLEPNKEAFIQEFSQMDYDALIGGWTDKIDRCCSGDQRWGLFYAEKKTS